MPFDDKTRNRLARFVTDARELIRSEFTEQLQRVYGISATGDITSLADLRDLDEGQRSVAEVLRERVDYLKASSLTEENPTTAAVDRLAREQAFTVLNRLAAIRMAEKRGFIVESVGHGYQSKGFQVYCQVAGSGLGDVYHRYRRYLFCLFDELAWDLGALFDRRSPASLLFPRESALTKLFELINAPDIDPLWAEDETIGWIYQYYNTKEERQKMREESATPRNSRELAVRNQFFTPRYVVQYLVDNTLGRIWYEMRKGDTRLKEDCRYQVRQPNEVFLGLGEKGPETRSTENLSQEELLKLPIHIPHRIKKDPRDLKILDPAVGSGHFLLYAFDLLSVIYKEAWEDTSSSAFTETKRTLRSEYSDIETLRRQLPELILRYNLHGIDIDLRACQIAALALWLRAQRAWQEQGLKLAERPQIRRSNIVCAEPMPGEPEMLEEFVSQLQPKVLGQLVRQVFEAMKLAGEAGPLLNIEEEISNAVADAKKQWLKTPKPEQIHLFGDSRPVQDVLGFDFTGITDEAFWEEAEGRIYAALQAYGEQAENGTSFQRRLFSDDTVHGFAFIDLCSKRYDVVLMNPPFGDASPDIATYIGRHYRKGKNDIGAAFVLRGTTSICDGGRLGAITNRTLLANQASAEWRREILGKACLYNLVDLGHGVLDAMVETMMYVCGGQTTVERSKPEPAGFINLLETTHKEERLNASLQHGQGLRWCDTSDFRHVPGSPWAYWVPSSLLRRFHSQNSFTGRGGLVCQGMASADNFRFFRLRWEIPPSLLHVRPHERDELFHEHRWSPIAKGGEYSLWWDDIHLVVDWAYAGAALKAYILQQYPYLNGNWSWVVKNTDKLYRRGSTYPYRTTSAFGLRLLPPGVSFSDGGWAIFAPVGWTDEGVLATFNTRIARYLMEVLLGQGDSSESGTAARNHVTAAVGGIPWPTLPPEQIETLVKDLVDLSATWTLDETSLFFYGSKVFSSESPGLSSSLNAWWERKCDVWARIAEMYSAVESSVASAYNLTEVETKAIDESEGFPLASYPHLNLDQTEIAKLFRGGLTNLTELAKQKCGSKRFTVKKAFFVDRTVDLACHIYQAHPASVVKSARDAGPIACGEAHLFVKSLVGWIVGVAFGRFSPERARPNSGPSSLPHLPRRSVEETEARFPIMVEDPGHRLDIQTCVNDALKATWKDRWEAVDREVCEAMGVDTMRNYLCAPTGFFADHLRCYSKSRRQAPVYWPLSTRSGSYTLWLYYPCLTTQTLHSCLADFLDPKLKNVSDEVRALRKVNGSQTRLGGLLEFEDELKEMRTEIERLIKLPYEPNLNDGVLITASPLWKLFRLPKWQKDLKTCWQELERGDCDWSHLAYSMWPDRVKEKCRFDRSISIAHGLEHLCSAEAPKSKPKRSRKKEATLMEEGTF